MRRYCSILIAVLCVLVVASCSSKTGDQPIDSETNPFGSPPWQPSGYYEHAPIAESSGFVVSRRYPGVCWTLNDSGNPATVYATTFTGELINEFSVNGASNRDWEGLTLDDEGRLWIGEIGNNSRLRTDLSVYVIPEPNPYGRARVEVIARYPYRYPGENVDAEGFFIHEGIPYIVSKEADRAVLYRFAELNAEQPHTLERVAQLNGARLVTGADISSDGSRIAVCTYGHLWVYHGTDALANLIQQTPWSLPHTFSPEALGFDGMDLILTSESRNIYRLPQWWYERELVPPSGKTLSALEQLSGTRAEEGEFAAQSYRQAGIDMDGGHLHFQGNGPGATLHQSIDIPYGDRYHLAVVMMHGPEYSQIQFLLDGAPQGEPHRAYAPEPTPGVVVSIGTLPLSSGTHEIGFRIVDQEPHATGSQLGIDSYQLRSEAQFADEFLVVGPFAKPEMFSLDTPLPPEQALNLSGSFQGLDNATVVWQRVPTAGASGLLDLQSALNPATGTTLAYALTYVYSETSREAQLLVGSDDQVAVWVNGQEAHRNDAMRGAKPDEDTVVCQLKGGWNEVLCKVGQNGGGWGLYLRANDPDGSLKYSTSPQE